MTDGEILRLIESRDEKAIAELERKYGAYCHTVAFNVLGNDEDADECVNDVLLKVWEAGRENAPKKLKPYLAATARNVAINRFKERTRQKRTAPGGTEPAAEDIAAAENDPLDRLALSALINEYLHTLPENKRRIFVARYYYDAPATEIARKLGMPEGTVNSTLNRVKSGLKKFLEKEGFGS
ncbi:MAG: sigma-70 family RNA polymerase sigma factor [Clostridia bacterium]|nr:sigma-70 family RNA polymerase sigma factor [Clostridia bacterium]MBR7062516.1 sigma-70 family RNA polymerase sigma factor [Clostridia bacterium]